MKKQLLIIPVILLASCATKSINSSVNPSSIDEFSSSIVNDSSFDSSTIEDNSTTSSTSKNSSSSKKGMSIILTSKTDSKDSSSIKEDPNALSYAQVAELFDNAMKHDNECSEVSFNEYDIAFENYTKSKYSSKLYENKIRYSEGLFTYTDFLSGNKIVSPFKEQAMYTDGVYSVIKKYESSFVNKANKRDMPSENADSYLCLGQAKRASLFFEQIKKNKYLIFDSKIIEDGYYISLEYYNAMDDNGYTNAGGIELTLDKNYYLIDLFYTEGSYDWMYIDSISRMRKHGPAPYGQGGIIYECSEFKYNQKVNYTDPIVFPLEENFIRTVSFKNTEENVLKSSQYVDLYNYVITDPVGGETFGCPYNNLVFTSSNPSIASVSSHYLDFNKTGEVTITVKDSATGAESQVPLKVIIA